MVRISYATIAIILTAVAALFYGAFALYGTWSNSHRLAVRGGQDNGTDPETDELGQRHAHQEEKEDHGSYRR